MRIEPVSSYAYGEINKKLRHPGYGISNFLVAFRNFELSRNSYYFCRIFRGTVRPFTFYIVANTLI